MKTKLVLLLWCLYMTTSLPIFAGATYVPLSVVGTNDGPSQDGKDPTTPNQFVVRVENRTLFISTTLDERVSLKLQNKTTNEDVANLTFIKTAVCLVGQYGSYVLTLQVGSTTLTGEFDVELSQDEAAEIALKMFENDNVEILVSNTTYEQGDTVHVYYEQLKNEYIIVGNRCWVAFVDLIPDANWSHGCQYLLIDAKSGNVVTYNRDMPPQRDEYKQYKSFGIKVLNQQDAFEIVDSIYKKDTVAIYISTQNYYGGETFELLNKDVIRVPYPLSMYWVFFVDLYPMENWEHPCEYIFVDAYTGKVTILKKMMFPINQEELFTLKRWDYKQNVELVYPADAAYSSQNPVFANTSIVSSEKIRRIDIYDIHGQKIMSTNNTTIDVPELSRGIYIVHAEMENGCVQTKLIKQ